MEKRLHVFFLITMEEQGKCLICTNSIGCHYNFFYQTCMIFFFSVEHKRRYSEERWAPNNTGSLCYCMDLKTLRHFSKYLLQERFETTWEWLNDYFIYPFKSISAGSPILLLKNVSDVAFKPSLKVFLTDAVSPRVSLRYVYTLSPSYSVHPVTAVGW